MTSRPKVHCPHCDAIFEASRLAANRKYRNQYGIDIFACPECAQSIKLEPSEYIFASQQIESGAFDEDTAIGAAAENEVLPSEQAAIAHARRRRAKGGCLPAVVWIGLGAWSLAYVISETVVR